MPKVLCYVRKQFVDSGKFDEIKQKIIQELDGYGSLQVISEKKVIFSISVFPSEIEEAKRRMNLIAEIELKEP